MAVFSYSLPAGRINRIKGEMLAYAIPHDVLGMAAQSKQLPKNAGDNVIYRRWLPFGASNANANTINRWVVDPVQHLVQEGVTPAADSLVPQDISVQLQEYACLYSFTNKANELYEDDVPAAEKQQCGERMGLVRELVRYGVFRAGTNVFYAGGGATRGSVNTRITLPLLRRVAKGLMANHCKMMSSVLAPSPNFATTPVEAAFVVFVHSDCEPDIRDLPGFKHVSEYGQRKPLHELEVGSCERFRFVVSAELAPYLNSGAAVGTTGMVATTTNVDVYPFLVVGQNAWGTIALRGMDSFKCTAIMPTPSAADPLGQRGYVGSRWYFNAVILNQGWMAVIEAGTTNVQ
jgi:N4-gp56 family major capsid protein